MNFWQIPWWNWLLVSIVGWTFCLLSALVTSPSRRQRRRSLAGSVLIFVTAMLGIAGFILFVIFAVRAAWLL